MPSKHQWMLAVIATDRTFERAVRGGVACWVGKCIHCGGKLVLGADGTPISAATLEHIWPRTHGGLTELANLALACARCNRGKGVRSRSSPPCARAEPGAGAIRPRSGWPTWSRAWARPQ